MSVAQLVEQLAVNQQVPGSSPGGYAKIKSMDSKLIYAIGILLITYPIGEALDYDGLAITIIVVACIVSLVNLVLWAKENIL